MKTPILLIILLLLHTALPSRADILGDPITNPVTGHVYYLLTQNTWTVSEAEAVNLGGHLATINDEAELTWLFNTFATFEGSPHALWIGLTDRNNEGSFVWISGEAASYRNWAPGEPNNVNNNENYAYILEPNHPEAGKWNDIADVHEGGSIYGVVEITYAPPYSGTVVAWGKDSATNVPAGLMDPVAIAAGFYHSLALRTDRTVVSWGGNNQNQTNVPTGLTNVVAVAAGDYHSLALRADGTVRGWGYNFSGQATAPADLSDAVAIAAGSSQSLALRANGTVVAWGRGVSGNQARVPPGLGNVVAIAVGSLGLAVRRDGTVVAWDPERGLLHEVPEHLTNTVGVAAFFTHNLALKADGTVVAWGSGSSPPTNVPVSLTSAIAIAAGYTHSLALRSDGTVAAWLPESKGSVSVPADLGNAVGIAAGAYFSLALIGGGPPFILAQPMDQSVSAGDAVQFLTSVSGGFPLSFHWRKGGVALPDQTNRFLRLSHVQVKDAGTYSVVVSNRAGSITSDAATLAVSPAVTVLVNGTPIYAESVPVRGSAAVDLLTPIKNGTIIYSLDGSDPSVTGLLYDGPFVITQTRTVRAVAYNPDFTQSVQSPEVNIIILPTLSVSTAGGGSMTVDPPAGAYLDDGTAEVTATPAPGWAFLQWLGDATGTNPATSVIMTRNRCVQAVFGTDLLSTVVGGGSVARSPAVESYPYGAVVQFTGMPQAGNYFALWGNANSGTNNPLSFTVTNAHSTVTAVFAALPANQQALTVVPNGFGEVTVSPRANRYSKGTSVTLTALPESGQSFLNWSNDASDNENPLVVTMNQSKVIRANFTKRPSLRVATCLEGVVEDGFRFTLTGESGTQYEILGSTNLLDWTQVGTAINAYGTTQFTDPAGTNFPNRFYRAVEP